MTTYTAGDQINGAYRLLNVLDQSETANATMLENGLTALNQMLDSWNTERLSVFATQDQSFSWTAGNISRTLGASGNFIGNRPILLDDSSYFIDPGTGVSYSFSLINQEQYDGIALKTATSTYPTVLFVNYDYPNISMYQYPVQTGTLTWHFISVTELVQPATSGTSFSIPPGYLRAFRFNLAVEIAMELGIDAPPTVKRIADISKRNIKRINNPDDLMGMPASILRHHARYNIFTGQP